jgi:hypothetical protein
MAMNAVVTSHLLVCLYSAAGGKVNHQVSRSPRFPHPLNSYPHLLKGGPLGAWRRIARPRVLIAWWATSRSEYFNRFSAMSSGNILIVSRQWARNILIVFWATVRGLLRRRRSFKKKHLREISIEANIALRYTVKLPSRELRHRTCLETKGCTDLKRKRPIGPW